MKSVFSNSSAGDGGLNVEIPQKGRQRNDSLMLSLKNRTAGKLQEMGGGRLKGFIYTVFWQLPSRQYVWSLRTADLQMQF